MAAYALFNVGQSLEESIYFSPSGCFGKLIPLKRISLFLVLPLVR